MTARDLINNPDYLAYKFNFATENVEFLPVNRTEIRRVSSLSLREIDPGRQLLAVPLAELAHLLDQPDQPLLVNPPRFIFHTAFCASTFLSRCLDVEGITVALREPQLLLDAANAKRLQWRSQSTALDFSHLPRLALLLLKKHAGPSEKLIIKPINSVNNIIPELLQMTGPGKSLMMYTGARNFLLSTLKKGEESKYAVRAMFDLIRCDFPHLANLRISDAIHMTDIKVILTLWRLQVDQAEQVLKNLSRSNTMASLYGELLIDQPVKAIRAAGAFLDLGISENRLQEIAKSDSRFNDAKNPGEQFSAEKRSLAYQKVEDYYGAELDKALRWMIQNNPGARLIPKLTSSLQF